MKDVQLRAFRIALLSVRDQEVALDMVQEAMLKLSKNYSDKPKSEWPPLFYRILQNCIRDWQRHQMVRSKVIVQDSVALASGCEDSTTWVSAAENAADLQAREPQHVLATSSAMKKLNQAIGDLSARQKEVFMLRAVEQLSIADTALSLQVSQGSIKTHYSRAIAVLREKLGEHWP